MKKIYTLVFTIIMALPGFAQTGIGTQTPNPDASLELGATDKGLLLNRVALTGTADATPLSAHVTGMTVYNTATAGDVIPGYYYNNGTQWVRIGSPDEGPFRNVSDGSSATNASTDIYYNGGNVGIGASLPSVSVPISKLHVTGGRIHNYLQDDYGGVWSWTSSDNELFHSSFITFRSRGTFDTPLYPINNDILGQLAFRTATTPHGSSIIGRATENHSATQLGSNLLFNTVPNGNTGTVQRMVIDQNGFVGIGTDTPTTTLEVNGQVKITDGTQGAGKVLTSDAAGGASWQNPLAGSMIEGTTGSQVTVSTAGAATHTYSGGSITFPKTGTYMVYARWRMTSPSTTHPTGTHAYVNTTLSTSTSSNTQTGIAAQWVFITSGQQNTVPGFRVTVTSGQTLYFWFYTGYYIGNLEFMETYAIGPF